MWVAHYRHGRDAYPQLVEFPDPDSFLTAYQDGASWPVVEHKMAPRGVDPKDHPPCPGCAPAWAPVRASYRSNAGVEEIWALVLDWDDVAEPWTLYQAAAPFRGLLHTTLNHWRKPNRLRGIFPYARPIPPHRHPKVFAAYQDFFGTRADPVSKSASAQYYFGRYENEYPKFWALPGTQFLDPWQLPGAETFSRHDLLDLARRYKRTDPTLAARFKSLHDGESFAQPVELGDGRDDAAFRLCSIIAKHYPTANPERVAILFAPSLAMMTIDHPEGALTHERIVEKLYRLFSAQSPQEEHETVLQRQFWESQGQVGRIGTYLPTEIEAMGSPETRDWILQHENGLYIRTPRGFDGPVQRATIRLRQALSVVPGTALFRADGTPYPAEALANANGRTVATIVHSLRASKASFDPKARVLRFAPTPLRELTPERSAFVDAWFTAAFDPEDRAAVEAWLTLLPDLTRPLSCLMLVGDQAAGKNLFAFSCARFWSTIKPATASKVLGRFNSEILTCPLAWIDEKLPEGPDGFFPLEEFKHLIGAETFAIEQKGVDTSAVEGYMRWIATANADLFTSAYSHTAEGNMALAKRVLRVVINPESSDFLRAHERYLHEEYMPNDVFPRHVLALPKYERTGERFGIVSAPTFERTLAVGSTWGGRICQVVVTWLTRPQSTKAFVLERGQLWVNAAALLDDWRKLSGGFAEVPKDLKQLQETIAPLCHPMKHKSAGARKEFAGRKYRELDVAKIKHWAEQNDVVSANVLDSALTPMSN